MTGVPQGSSAVRVLVADDTSHVREVVAQMLALDGFDVVGTAVDGEDAVAQALLLSPDVVVMDLRMPVCDGLEATRRVRAAQPSVQVVLYTAYVDDEVRDAAAAAGAALCLGKVEGLPRLERELSRLMLGRVQGGPDRSA